MHFKKKNTYKNHEGFGNELNKLWSSAIDINIFQNTCTDVLNKHTPLKQNMLDQTKPSLWTSNQITLLCYDHNYEITIRKNDPLKTGWHINGKETLVRISCSLRKEYFEKLDLGLLTIKCFVSQFTFFSRISLNRVITLSSRKEVQLLLTMKNDIFMFSDFNKQPDWDVFECNLKSVNKNKSEINTFQ